MRFCELQKKEVINTTDCKCLGNVSDLEFDECDGVIKTIIVPGPAKWLGCIAREFEIFIPWDKIEVIGNDSILISMDGYLPSKQHKKGAFKGYFYGN